MLGLEPDVVKLYPHDGGWRCLFETEKKKLQSTIGEFVLDIQHVGSTAIPGIPAKPIIDIAIAVHNFEEAEICIAPIERLGYVYRGENGIARRHYFRKGEPRTHHLHLMEASSRNWENQILFRDYLRQHPAAAHDYAALKNKLARLHRKNRQEYTLQKAPYIEEILRLARDKPEADS